MTACNNSLKWKYSKLLVPLSNIKVATRKHSQHKCVSSNAQCLPSTLGASQSYCAFACAIRLHACAFSSGPTCANQWAAPSIIALLLGLSRVSQPALYAVRQIKRESSFYLEYFNVKCHLHQTNIRATNIWVPMTAHIYIHTKSLSKKQSLVWWSMVTRRIMCDHIKQCLGSIYIHPLEVELFGVIRIASFCVNGVNTSQAEESLFDSAQSFKLNVNQILVAYIHCFHFADKLYAHWLLWNWLYTCGTKFPGSVPRRSRTTCAQPVSSRSVASSFTAPNKVDNVKGIYNICRPH